MLEIGDCVKIKDDHRWCYIYDIFNDACYTNYYQVVWMEEDLYKRWSPRPRILFWENELVLVSSSKMKRLKNGKRIVIGR